MKGKKVKELILTEFDRMAMPTTDPKLANMYLETLLERAGFDLGNLEDNRIEFHIDRGMWIYRQYIRDEEKQEKFYFITYTWRARGFSNWSFANAVIVIHPFKWLQNRREDSYVLVSFEEISEEDYKSLNGII